MFSITRDQHKRDYTCVANGVLRDERLSLEAKGFMAIVLSLPDDWDFSVRGIAKVCGVTIRTIYRILAELQANGYLELSQETNGNKFLPVHYVFSEFPETKSDIQDEEMQSDLALARFAQSANAHSANTHNAVALSANATQSNTNIPNTEKTNKKELITQSINLTDVTEEKEEFFSEGNRTEFVEAEICDSAEFPESGGAEEYIDVEYAPADGSEPPEEPAAEEQPEPFKRQTLEQTRLQINADRLGLVYDRVLINRIAFLITECINSSTRMINGEIVTADRLRRIFGSATGADVSNAIKAVESREVKNFEGYYATTLFNLISERIKDKPVFSGAVTESADSTAKSKGGFENGSLDIAEIMKNVMAKYRETTD